MTYVAASVSFRPGYEILGAHLTGAGAHFSVRAPHAESVHVTGDFNDWANPGQVLTQRPGSGVWSGEVAQAAQGDAYQFRIQSRLHPQPLLKADPYAIYAQAAPGIASRLWTLDYTWQDQIWMRKRSAQQAFDRPVCVYEVHLGSWRRRRMCLIIEPWPLCSRPMCRRWALRTWNIQVFISITGSFL